MTPSSSPTSRRRLATLVVAAAALLLPSGASAATSAAPTVEADVADRAITVKGAEHLGRGPVRLHLSGKSLTDSRTVAVVELERGVTANAAEHDLDRLLERGRLVAGANVSATSDYATTITARAREHLIVDVTAEHGGEARFTVSDEASGARLPKSDATIAMRDKGLYLPPSFPRAASCASPTKGSSRIRSPRSDCPSARATARPGVS